PPAEGKPTLSPERFVHIVSEGRDKPGSEKDHGIPVILSGSAKSRACWRRLQSVVQEPSSEIVGVMCAIMRVNASYKSMGFLEYRHPAILHAPDPAQESCFTI